jgi:iron complex transport system permease protein
MHRTAKAGCLLLAAPVVVGLCLMAGASGWGWPGSSALMEARAIRLAAGLVVGAALALSGATLQAILRNPLAEPYVLGVSGGGALGAALAILSGLAGSHLTALPVAAFLGGLVTLALVCAIAGGGRDSNLHSLLLSGVIVSALASSLLLVLITFSSSDEMRSVLWWMMGSLDAVSPPLLAVCGLLTAGAGIGLRAMARELNALTLGQEIAYHVGVPPRRTLLLGLALSTLAAAAAVALAGLIGFVGLIIPHAVRRLFGPDHRVLLPVSALAGALFLAICDALARSVTAPVELPVGVLTALTGGPFFLFLLSRNRWGDMT